MKKRKMGKYVMLWGKHPDQKSFDWALAYCLEETTVQSVSVVEIES